MIAKDITYEQIKEAIKTAFEFDNDLVKYYDPNTRVDNIDEIVTDVIRKVGTYKDRILWKGVFEGDKLVGYFVYSNLLLISFGLNINYRDKKRKFFVIIRKTIGKRFITHLHSVNKRALKFLVHNGMKIVSENHLITKLCTI